MESIERNWEVYTAQAPFRLLRVADVSVPLMLSGGVLSVLSTDDSDHRIARAALAKALVSRVVLHEGPDGWYLELHGPMVPKDLPPLRINSPLREVRDALVAYDHARSGHEADGPEAGHFSVALDQHERGIEDEASEGTTSANGDPPGTAELARHEGELKEAHRALISVIGIRDRESLLEADSAETDEVLSVITPASKSSR
jgi:hypothetical protein